MHNRMFIRLDKTPECDGQTTSEPGVTTKSFSLAGTGCFMCLLYAVKRNTWTSRRGMI